MTVIAPNNLQFGRVEPYISVTEFLASPTASMLDYSNFVQGGTQAQQNAAVQQLIYRASSKADQYCMGPLGTLNATANTEGGRYNADRQGCFRVHPSFSPILEVSAFQWGPTPGMGNVLTLSSDNCWIERQEIVVSALVGSGTSNYLGINALTSIIGGPGSWGGPQFCQWTYINGFANTFTSASVTLGATSIPVNDPTGIYPGMTLTIWDSSNDEIVTVSSSYVAGSSTVTLAAGTQFAHASATNISALPASVKQAVIHFTVAMVRQRGQGGFIIDQLGAGEPVIGKVDTGDDDEIRGYDLLEEFRIVSGLL
ncbi:MAG: hypothetical protein KGH65_04930 [Candidatus Micrarchaeota archaeon]|nr:hypothetical protein [Candidatus Micrarchaeota archaeon]